MKIIEALKKIKELQKKCEDLREKIQKHCSLSSLETSEYADQRSKIKDWLQSHSDIIKEILRLRVAIQNTNIKTYVTIELGDKQVEKTIAEWIHRRRDLAKEDLKAWKLLGDKDIKEGTATGPGGSQIEIKILRFYDPEQRDRMVGLYDSEPGIIDAKLEIVNAITDLIE